MTGWPLVWRWAWSRISSSTVFTLPACGEREQRRRRKRLLRQGEHVHRVAAGNSVRLWRHAQGGHIGPAAGRDGEVLAAIHRIRDREAQGLRGQPGLPQDLAVVGV